MRKIDHKCKVTSTIDLGVLFCVFSLAMLIKLNRLRLCFAHLNIIMVKVVVGNKLIRSSKLVHP